MWASTGRAVILHDTNPIQLAEAMEYVGDTLTAYCSENGTRPGHVHSTMDFHEAVQNSWMVIEAIPEKLDSKIALLGRLDRILSRDCIIATNSSSYKSSELLGDVKNFKDRVLNTHYYIPPRNTYVELMTCGHTAPAIFPFLFENMLSVSLHPILVPKESYGLIFNRIWGATKRETLMVLAEGLAKPRDIDALFKNFFHAEKGPCAKMDEVGLDTIAMIESHYLEARPEMSRVHLEWLMKGYVNGWALGDKTSSGLYTAAEKLQVREREAGRDFEEGLEGVRATGGQ
jgi:3-hydroxyacyl-CoA dehydrogenase